MNRHVIAVICALIIVGGVALFLATRPVIAPPAPTATPTLTPPPTATPTPLDACDPRATAGPPPTGLTPTCTFTIVAEYPHDAAAFTQGLQFVDGVLYEGTGLDGQSSLRRVDLESGTVEQRVDLGFEYFGEGITVLGDRIFQLTWDTNIGFVYDRATFTQLQTFEYPTEGWGLTHDGQRLIMSDGSPTLYTLDAQTLAQTPLANVADATGPIALLNELEYINGYVYANVWKTDRIAKIVPETGQVVAWLELSGLRPAEAMRSPEAVLNGIAYDAANDRLFVTGKLWPKLFEIKLHSAP
jgi:glutamine cyclotransferase